MACHLFERGWHVEDINLRLGHSPQSKWLDSYINYLAINRQRAKKMHYNNNLEDLKDQFEETKQREKLHYMKIDDQQKRIEVMEEDKKKMDESIRELTSLMQVYAAKLKQLDDISMNAKKLCEKNK